MISNHNTNIFLRLPYPGNSSYLYEKNKQLIKIKVPGHYGEAFDLSINYALQKTRLTAERQITNYFTQPEIYSIPEVIILGLLPNMWQVLTFGSLKMIF